MRLPAASVSVEVGERVGERVPLTLSTTATALYVTLTTKAQGDRSLLSLARPRPRALALRLCDGVSRRLSALCVSLRAGRFSQNAFLLPAGAPASVDFLPWGAYGAPEVSISTRILG